MGIRKNGNKVGFDVSYEHNFFKDPILKREFIFMDGPIDDPTEYIVHSYNVTTSCYIFKEFRNWDLYFNPGINIGYTAFFLRLGAVWRLKTYWLYCCVFEIGSNLEAVDNC